MDLLSLLGAATAALAFTVVLLAIEPVLVPFVLLGHVPLLSAMFRNSQASYHFGFSRTQTDRHRLYLGTLLTDKDAAQELRAFGLQQLSGRLKSVALTSAVLYEQALFVGDINRFAAMQDTASSSEPAPADRVAPFRALVVDDVSYTYPNGRSALHGVSMHIQA